MIDDNPTIPALVLRVAHDQLGNIEQDELTINPERDQAVLPIEQRYMDYINLDVLARIATIVEKYQIHVGIEDCLHKWISNLKDYVESTSVPDAIKWLWVTWLFHYADHFFIVTEYLVKNLTMSLAEDNSLQFPIPIHVLRDQLDPYIDSTATGFELRVTEGTQHEDSSNLCFDILNFGFLMMFLQSMGLSRGRMWDDPDFDGVSFAEIAKKLRAKASLIDQLDDMPDELSDPLEPVWSF
ncbi:uncharacterized protein N7496_008594 [Penicillium cataractarum]|uniref:Uncharacterized protein n=1 Tax=Penicillium cataractarum TaxID=2100454 RepID=A0A9W9S0J5_9EURO|nr:uncharacterized protein N7496_008594 [Penicillium cataractarum]KAJ5368834.1 hypothetical protein N7496_008594 [Penicillium cataractarum]